MPNLHLTNLQLFCPPPHAPIYVSDKSTLEKVQSSKNHPQNLVFLQTVLLNMQLLKLTYSNTTSDKSDILKSYCTKSIFSNFVSSDIFMPLYSVFILFSIWTIMLCYQPIWLLFFLSIISIPLLSTGHPTGF